MNSQETVQFLLICGCIIDTPHPRFSITINCIVLLIEYASFHNVKRRIFNEKNYKTRLKKINRINRTHSSKYFSLHHNKQYYLLSMTQNHSTIQNKIKDCYYSFILENIMKITEHKQVLPPQR